MDIQVIYMHCYKHSKINMSGKEKDRKTVIQELKISANLY